MIKYILFDLDDTLYPTSAGMMQEISTRMSEWMMSRLNIPADDVDRQRQDYWARYGTTLRGLYVERQIDPQDFMNFVHDVQIEKYLQPDSRLDTMLSQLPQIKAIFTNAPADYARRVLGVLGIEKHFAKMFDINFIAFQSKPASSAYEKLIATLPVRADECMMIDDTSRNLVPAKKLGMQTVWLDYGNNRHGSEGKESADFIIQSIYNVANIL
jgi:putative hydrolase of the HAD superfamily